LFRLVAGRAGARRGHGPRRRLAAAVADPGARRRAAGRLHLDRAHPDAPPGARPAAEAARVPPAAAGSVLSEPRVITETSHVRHRLPAMQKARRRFLRASVCLLAGIGCTPASEKPSTSPPAAPPDAIVVRLSYGSEKKAFLESSIAAFHRTNP